MYRTDREGTGLLEGLVDGPEPAHIRAGGEEDEPQDGHAEVGRSTTTAHPCQTANQINSQRGTIHCRHQKQRESMTSAYLKLNIKPLLSLIY